MFKIEEFKIGNQSVTRYVLYSAKSINIFLPLTNCTELIEYLNLSKESNISNKFNKKFDIYIPGTDKEKLSNAFADLLNKPELDSKLINIGYGNFKDVNCNNLYKLRIILNKYSKNLNKNNEPKKSIILQTKILNIYHINDKYYVNVIVHGYEYSTENYDHQSICYSNKLNNYEISDCNISKIKKRYKSYVLDLGKNIKNKNILIDI